MSTVMPASRRSAVPRPRTRRVGVLDGDDDVGHTGVDDGLRAGRRALAFEREAGLEGGVERGATGGGTGCRQGRGFSVGTTGRRRRTHGDDLAVTNDRGADPGVRAGRAAHGGSGFERAAHRR